MGDTVTISTSEYDRLCAMAEDLADIRAVLSFQVRMEAGAEEFVPAAIADRLIDGESPLRVWRDYRGMSQSGLARAAGVDRVQIVDIEAGRANGSVRTLAALANALNLAVDDLVPAHLSREDPSIARGALKSPAQTPTSASGRTKTPRRSYPPKLQSRKSTMARDTYKYHFKRGNKILHTGITNDLDRREREHQGSIDPKGHISQVGRRTTHDGAKSWEDDQRAKGKPTGP